MSAKATDKSFGEEEEEVLAANENNDSAVVKATADADPTISSEPAQNDTDLLEKNDSADVKATVDADPTMPSEPARNDTALLEKGLSGSEEPKPNDAEPIQDDANVTDKENSEPGSGAEDPVASEDPTQNDTSLAEEQIQNDTSLAEELIQNDTSVAEETHQEDTSLVEEVTKEDTSVAEKSDKPQPGYKIPKINFQACRAAWEQCKSPDKDYLTLSQFEKACESIGLVSTDYEKRFKQLDKNKNGKLEWVEYLKVLVTK
jgi:hypothetical protein